MAQRFQAVKIKSQDENQRSLQELLVIKDSIKIDKKQPTNQNGSDCNKNLKNPYWVHNGNHEWADCWHNPKNNNNNQQRTNKREQKRGGNNNNNRDRNREEQRITENQDGHEQGRTPIKNWRTRTADYDDEELLCIIDKMEHQTKKKVSAEILIAIPTSKGSKKKTLRTLDCWILDVPAL